MSSDLQIIPTNRQRLLLLLYQLTIPHPILHRSLSNNNFALTMDAHTDVQHDLEPNKLVPDMRSLLHGKIFLEAAAILSLRSVLVLNGGAIRVNDKTPLTEFFAGFGVLGVYLGAAALLFRWYRTKFTYFSMGVQTLLGYYVFIVYTFVRPIFRSVDLAEPILPGLSLGESRFIISMGIRTSEKTEDRCPVIRKGNDWRTVRGATQFLYSHHRQRCNDCSPGRFPSCTETRYRDCKPPSPKDFSAANEFHG